LTIAVLSRRLRRNGVKPSAVIDTRVIYCGDNLEQLKKLPPNCVDLIYIDPPFNSNRNYEIFWGETKEKRSFEDRHESTKAYIDYMRPCCVELHRSLKRSRTGSGCSSSYVFVNCRLLTLTLFRGGGLALIGDADRPRFASFFTTPTSASYNDLEKIKWHIVTRFAYFTAGSERRES
jgi:hypothetical protein